MTQAMTSHGEIKGLYQVTCKAGSFMHVKLWILERMGLCPPSLLSRQAGSCARL